MMKPSCCISVLGLRTKISLLESSIGNGSSHTSGMYLSIIESARQTHLSLRGFRSSFDRGCLSLWFNFRRNVSFRNRYCRAQADHCSCSFIASRLRPLIVFFITPAMILFIICTRIKASSSEVHHFGGVGSAQG